MADIDAAFQELQAEVSRLTAGADPTPIPEGVMMTPGQLLHRLNTATAQERFRLAERILDAQGEAWRCFMHSHSAYIEELRDQMVRDRALAQWLIAEARWVFGYEPAGHV